MWLRYLVLLSVIAPLELGWNWCQQIVATSSLASSASALVRCLFVASATINNYQQHKSSILQKLQYLYRYPYYLKFFSLHELVPIMCDRARPINNRSTTQLPSWPPPVRQNTTVLETDYDRAMLMSAIRLASSEGWQCCQCEGMSRKRNEYCGYFQFRRAQNVSVLCAHEKCDKCDEGIWYAWMRYDHDFSDTGPWLP
ncbi:hypothetical protein DL98DRAFT_512749 [Cadophora sp. DSE1049]|nr:hypothetical protein DL98DRAFT_512749 [Cadophora sp. DSE1049]